MKHLLNIFVPLILCLGLSFCSSVNQGGSEAGNPPTSIRTVKGNVSATETTSSSLVKYHAHDVGNTCLADTLVAVDSSANEFETTVDAACNFSINLTINRAYELNFFLNEEFVAFMLFQNDSNAIITPVMILSASEDDMDLGVITFNNFECTPENEPASQNDQDLDGTFDFDDSDDDDDGTMDDDESDCDLDGFLDQFDDEFNENFDCDGEDDENIPDILDIYPWNGDEYIDLLGEVLMLFSCIIDPDTINASTFVITDPDDNQISCDYVANVFDNIIGCFHDSDPYIFDQTYTATVSGLECEDGTPVPDLSWTWFTGESPL